MLNQYLIATLPGGDFRFWGMVCPKRDRVRVGFQVAGCKVRVLLHHFDGFPSAQFLDHQQRRAGLHMPGRPGVPQVVKPEILEAYF
ncbi:hypothetical protein [Castellaniella denitrificans]|uniref:Uncharacterized protein n=1 Tax=Castellaniella denitrificans TaxID=56119 RepID=A0ABT4M5Z2_9BURK|nr:hypothetical protein [Castellaniella denitrificans]MCZ4330730.1 hypothetical protein [Castellaniella denitrificans]